jgi:hypothetical protein
MAIYYARKAGNVNATDVWATTPSGTASNLFPSFTSADTLMSNGFTVTLNVNTTVLEVRNDTANGATTGGSYTVPANVTLTANAVAGSTASVLNFSVNSPDSCAVVGTITGATSGSVPNGSVHSGSGTVNITGNVIGGTNSTGFSLTGSGTVNITGNVSAPSTGSGISHSGAVGTLNITGNVSGAAGSGVGVLVFSSGACNIVGTATGGVATAGVGVTGSGTVTITRAKGNGFGNGSVGLSAAVGVSAVQNANCRVYEIEYGDLGQSPTSGPIILLDATSNVAIMYRTSGGKKTLIDSAASAGYPAPSNVRSGVSYANGNQTGTCAVPAPSSVALGVAVDNTTGTAVLTQANVETALASFSSGRLSNCATVASVGQQIIALVET